MAHTKVKSVWGYVPTLVREAVENYLQEHNESMSDFVRSAVIEKLLNEGFMDADTLRELVT